MVTQVGQAALDEQFAKLAEEQNAKLKSADVSNIMYILVLHMAYTFFRASC